MKPALLLVDDDYLVADLIEAALDDAGFEVVVASTPAQAMAVLEQRAADLAGLVTDINLKSKVDGYGVAQQARELAPRLPVVYTTGDHAHQWPSRGVPNSILITKPFVPAQIVTAISSLLNTRC